VLVVLKYLFEQNLTSDLGRSSQASRTDRIFQEIRRNQLGEGRRFCHLTVELYFRAYHDMSVLIAILLYINVYQLFVTC
jgi:hypothetical protein